MVNIVRRNSRKRNSGAWAGDVPIYLPKTFISHAANVTTPIGLWQINTLSGGHRLRRPPLHAVPQLVDQDAGRPGVFPLSHCWAAEARGWGEGPAGVGRTAGAPGVGGRAVGKSGV